MATQKQIDANRRNARRSTGPKTREGKDKSKYNAVNHGATARTGPVLPGEDPEVYKMCARAVYQTYAPEGAYEIVLVDRIIEMEWRLTRLHRFENGMLQNAMAEIAAARSMGETEHCGSVRLLGLALENKLTQLNLLARYETSLQRSIERTAVRLTHLQKMRLGETAPSSSRSPELDALAAFLDSDLEMMDRELEQLSAESDERDCVDSDRLDADDEAVTSPRTRPPESRTPGGAPFIGEGDEREANRTVYTHGGEG